MSFSFRVLFFLFSAFARAADVYPYPNWALNRTFSVSNDGPFAKIVNADPDMADAARGLLTHFDLVGNTMDHLARTANYVSTRRQTLCNATNAEAVVAISARFHTLGFGGGWTSSCITDIQVGAEEKAWNDMRILAGKLNVTGMKVVSATKLDWEVAHPHSNFSYQGNLQICNFYHSVAFRVAQKWNLLLSVTSLDPNKSIKDRERHYLEEYLQTNITSISNSNNKPQLINLPMSVNNTKFVRVPTTTTKSSWGTTPSASIFLAVWRPDDTPAVKAAIESSSKWLEVAEDSLSAANISIMILSLALALLPIAAFADVGHIVTLVYTLATDIISCLPLLIKGIELVDLSDVNHTAIRTRVYGMLYLSCSLFQPFALDFCSRFIARIN